jgi:hypothetical protein
MPDKQLFPFWNYSLKPIRVFNPHPHPHPHLHPQPHHTHTDTHTHNYAATAAAAAAAAAAAFSRMEKPVIWGAILNGFFQNGKPVIW